MSRRLAPVIALAIAALSAGYPDRAGAVMASYRLNTTSNLYIRHNFGLGKVTPVNGWFHSEDLDRSDATWVLHFPGLDGTPNSVSLESLNYPGQFLRHRFWRIRLDANDGSELFRKDATFRYDRAPYIVRDRGEDDRTFTFQSVNYPGYYINARLDNRDHPRWGALWLDKWDGDYEGAFGLEFVRERPLAIECVRFQGPCP